MVFVFYGVIALGVMALLWGGMWVLKIAFGISTGWGLACLFFPPVFLARKWGECRLPFFINLTGILIFVVGMMGLAGYTENAKVKELARVEWEDVDPVSRGGPETDPWWNENQGEADFVESSGFVNDTDEVEVDDSAGLGREPTPDVTSTKVESLTSQSALPTPTPLPHWLRKWGRLITRDEYQSFVGSMVQVYTSDGQTFRVVLVRVSDSSIRVRERVGSGSMEFSLEHGIVTEVRVKD